MSNDICYIVEKRLELYNLFQLLFMLCLFFVIIELVIIMEFKVTSNDVMDTIELAQNLESEKFPNMIICLDGDFHKDGVVIIEWADTIEDVLPEERLDIKFKLVNGRENTRVLILKPHGKKYEDLCEAVL